MKLLLPLRSLAAAAALFASASLFASNVGQTLPPLKLTYVKNEVAYAGKPMILEFWATWCPPCRKSIPHLNELYGKYKDRGLVAIGVSDEEKGVVEGFLKKIPMDYTVALDPEGKLASGFGVTAIPHALLVDKTGKIVWEGHPMSLKEKDLEALLK